MNGEVCLSGIVRRQRPVNIFQRGTHQLLDLNGGLSAILMSDLYDLNAFNGQLVRICGINQGLIENYASILVTKVFSPTPCPTCRKKLKTYRKHQNSSSSSSTTTMKYTESQHNIPDCDEPCPVYPHPIFPPRPQPPVRPIQQPFIQPIPIPEYEPVIITNPNSKIPVCPCLMKRKRCKKCRH